MMEWEWQKAHPTIIVNVGCKIVGEALEKYKNINNNKIKMPELSCRTKMLGMQNVAKYQTKNKLDKLAVLLFSEGVYFEIGYGWN